MRNLVIGLLLIICITSLGFGYDSQTVLPCQTDKLTTPQATITSTTISSIDAVPANAAAVTESEESIEGETCLACSRAGVNSAPAAENLNMVPDTDAKTSCPCGNEDSSNVSVGIANPAAVYCREMGYEYKVVKTKDGEKGIVVFPDGSECDEWAFYRGEEKQEFSHCAKNGWAVDPEGEGDAFSTRCTTCVLKDGSKKTVNKLLKLDEKVSGKLKVGEEPQPTLQTQVEPVTSLPESVSLPEHFDWRNNSGNWMTPVKNQGACGSCWAFSAVGTVEPQYNLATGNPDLDLDLSEQYLVSDCYSSGDCGGGWAPTALAYIRDQGITDEACFPYTATNSPCNRCSDWSDRLYTIDETGAVSADVATIRQELIDKGPLSAAMRFGLSGCGFDANNIYRCSPDGTVNHAVVIAGYDESDNCWIVKNSHGLSFGDEGYFKVGCGECSIEYYVRYATKEPVTPPPAPALTSPADSASVPGTSITFSWSSVPGATNYAVQVSTSPSFSPLFHYNYTSGTTSKTYTDFPNNGTTYYWRARAYNPAGWGDWSSSRSFLNGTAPPTPPPAPALTSPADAASVPGTSITFSWSSVPGATNYAVQVSTSPSFSPLFHYNYTKGATSFTYTDFPNNGTTYYWRARAYNTAGWGDWSSSRSFVNSISGDLPPAPSLTSPADAASVPGTSITFSWSSVSGATNYAVQVSTSPTFSPLFHYNYTKGATSFTYTDFPNNGTTYYWRARAYNPAGWGDWSSSRSFLNGTAPAIPPPAPALTSPADAASVPGTSITFSWSSVSGATNYAVQVSTSPSFSPLFHYNYTRGATSFTYNDFPNNGTTYYWRARAYNPAGWGIWSDSRNFINSP